jgi:hypothetical protein
MKKGSLSVHNFQYFRVGHEFVGKLLSESTLTGDDKFSQSPTPVVANFPIFLGTQFDNRLDKNVLVVCSQPLAQSCILLQSDLTNLSMFILFLLIVS